MRLSTYLCNHKPYIKIQGLQGPQAERGEADVDPQGRRLLNRVRMSALHLGVTLDNRGGAVNHRYEAEENKLPPILHQGSDQTLGKCNMLSAALTSEKHLGLVLSLAMFQVLAGRQEMTSWLPC